MDEQQPGVPQVVEPLVTRVLANNPSAFTNTGTQVHLVGTTDLAVIDPGPDTPAHIDALTRAIAGRAVKAILVTHNHRDHSPGAASLQRSTGAPILGCAPVSLGALGARTDTSFDQDYTPDRVLGDGDRVSSENWTLTAVATPGHTSNHLAFALSEVRALFTGDHVMGWSTTIVSPPDGDMAAYMNSLVKLQGRDDRIYYPAHGDPVHNPQRLVRGLITHRKQREGQILRLLGASPHSALELVGKMYVGIDTRLILAAERSVLAHLYDLSARGHVEEASGTWRKK